MELQKAKMGIKIVSSDPKTNKLILDQIKTEGDCFGVGYSDNEDCKKCNILAELEEKREPLFQICKSLSLGEKDGMVIEDGKIPEEVKPEKEAEVNVEEVKVEEVTPEEKSEDKGEKVMDETTEKKVSKKKEKSEKSEKKNEFKHNLKSQSAVMDELLKAGSNIADAEKILAEKWSDYRLGRFKGHIRHLVKEHGLKVDEKDGVYKIE
jgi:hypothetical protein